VINDLHLGVQRTGGTTISSAAALRDWGHEQHAKLLALAPQNGCERVVVNGDLTDVYDIPLLHALRVYEDTDNFLMANPGIELVWALGNHDLSKDSSRLGTVAFIGMILAMKHPGRFQLISGAQALDAETYVLPHVANQDLFEYELGRVPESTKYLLLHCNFDNIFACASDHSLNLSRDQAKALKAKGITMIFGHEHQGREVLGGAVVIVGNQFPTSIADCLSHGDGQKNGTKRALVINHTNDPETEKLEFIETWRPDAADGWFEKIDWRDLGATEEEGRGFIRVEGTANSAESAAAIKAIAAFRQRSQSFVITNAVQAEKLEGVDELAESIEDIRSVNVIEMLLEMLVDPKQRAAVQALYSTPEAAT
jgi:hypothetical protein